MGCRRRYPSSSGGASPPFHSPFSILLTVHLAWLIFFSSPTRASASSTCLLLLLRRGQAVREPFLTLEPFKTGG
ncbi:hypothetical protein QBC39DRAFT_346639 [Podospora conica]|nr:hypothetical protein QBC39DRAFT_346639 [Schizothecium conicum]